jgi:hypothetical protein
MCILHTSLWKEGSMTQQTGRVICGRCRHPRPLHSNGETGCLARGCHSGPDGGPCPKFTLETIVPAAAVDRPGIPVPQFRSTADYDDLAAAAGQ